MQNHPKQLQILTLSTPRISRNLLLPRQFHQQFTGQNNFQLTSPNQRLHKITSIPQSAKIFPVELLSLNTSILLQIRSPLSTSGQPHPSNNLSPPHKSRQTASVAKPNPKTALRLQYPHFLRRLKARVPHPFVDTFRTLDYVRSTPFNTNPLKISPWKPKSNPPKPQILCFFHGNQNKCSVLWEIKTHINNEAISGHFRVNWTKIRTSHSRLSTVFYPCNNSRCKKAKNSQASPILSPPLPPRVFSADRTRSLPSSCPRPIGGRTKKFPT